MTRPLFLYGTLRYLPLLKLVAGAELTYQDALLHDYMVHRVEGADFPRIVEGKGQTSGILVTDAASRARLDYYEGGYGYGFRTVTVVTDNGPVEADIYWPGPDVAQPAEPFELKMWVERWGLMTRYAAMEAMEGFGQISAETLAARFPQIRARAWSRVMAERDDPVDHLSGRPKAKAEIREFRRPYTHFFSVVEHDLTFPLFDGSQSAPVNRAALVAADAVVVLPYDPVRDRVLLVEQFRPAMFFRGDADAFSIEAVAGRIDPGETPEDAAKREAQEEAGIELRALHKVTANYPSPGALTEYLVSYVAIADLPDGTAGMGGVESEDENIRSHLFEYRDFLDWLDRDQFRNGPLILLGHWLARHRERLR